MSARKVLALADSVRAVTPCGEVLDEFQAARRQAEAQWVELDEGQEADLVRILDSEDHSPTVKKAAGELLFRAHAPTALFYAARAANDRTEFSSALSAAYKALWQIIARWRAEDGMSLEALIRLALPHEYTRAINEEGASNREWQIVMVRSAMADIVEKYQAIRHTKYDGEVVELDEATTKEEMKAVKATLSRWTKTATKADVEKVRFFGRNKPRKQQRSRTGYKVAELKEVGQEFKALEKLSGRRSLAKVFRHPGMPMRRSAITARMVRAEMEYSRKKKGILLGKQWSLGTIELLMKEAYDLVSYDVRLNTEADETFLDLMGVYHDPLEEEEIEGDEDVPEFNETQTADASHMVGKLQQSGLWEVAMNLPLKKFMAAYQNGNTKALAELCHAYGVRMRHARDICGIVDIGMSDYRRDRDARLEKLL